MIWHLIDELLDPQSELWIRLAGLDPDEVGRRMEQAAKEALERVAANVDQPTPPGSDGAGSEGT